MSELSYLEKLLDGVEVEWLPLGKLGELVRGNGLPKSDFTESGVPAIHYGQIYTFYGLSTETTKSFVSHETAKKLKKVNSGDVVITNTSENFTDVGKALVYLGKEQAVTGGHATIFKPNSTIIGKYFAYFTQTDSFANEKRKYSKGTKVIDVSASDMAKIIIPIPCPDNPEKSLAIQSEIVRILDKFDTLTSSITEGLPREIELRQKQYEYYRDKLLSFEEGGVEWKTLGEITTKIASGRNKTRDADGKFPVYGSTGLIGFIDKAAYSGDLLLVARVGAYAGLVNAVSGHFDVSDNTLIIHPSDSWNVRFAFHQLRHMNLNQYAVGAGQPLITGGLLKNLKVPFPSLKEQTRIAKILDKFETITASISEGLPREIELRQKQYEYYRDKLLSFEEGGVEWKTLGEIVKMRAGQHISARNIVDGKEGDFVYPCFGGNGIRGYVKEKSHDGEHLLIGRQGALCGNVQRMKGQFYATEHAVVVSAMQGIDIDWAFHMLTTMNLNQYASKSAQPGLAVGKLQELKLLVPSIERQKYIAKILDKFDTLTSSITEGLPREIELRQKQYEYYRDKLLSFEEGEVEWN